MELVKIPFAFNDQKMVDETTALEEREKNSNSGHFPVLDPVRC